MIRFLGRINWDIVLWIMLGLAFGLLEWVGIRSGLDRKWTASHLIETALHSSIWIRYAFYFLWAWLGWHLFILGRHHIFH